MFKINNFTNNDDVTIIAEKGPFQVIQYKRDLSVSPSTAVTAYFCDKMNIRKRQVLCDLSKSNGIICQSGAMQWTVGNVNASTGVKGAADFLGKFVKGKVTGESAIKPEYVGDGLLVLEPTYRHIILLDTSMWNGKVVLDDGLFLACDASVKQKLVARSNVSSAVLGGEGLFNLALDGNGIAVLECRCPQEELIEVTLENDVLKVDGSFAIAWSDSLSFTVERSGKTLVGSAASGEGLVNVYRGTGKILLAPIDKTIGDFPVSTTAPSAPASAGTKTGGALGSLLGGLADALD
ncbi:MAG: AIM24 family protein [Clostridia bacterium]|nr:AIM24 family protein [Clostridia bacterium]